MIDWERVPWSLWAYLGCVVVNAGFFIVRSLNSTSVHHPTRLLVTSLLVWILVNYFLLRGIWWLWIATIVLLGAGVLVGIATATILWWALVIAVIQIVLLLSPATRRFFERREVRA